MDGFCKNDISAYLQVFAKNLGHDIDPDDKLISSIVNQIDIRISRVKPIPPFEQSLPTACRKCRLRYSERGDVTKKEYKYCIRTDNTSYCIPCDCPMNGQKKDLGFGKIEDGQDIIDIRERSKR